MVTGNAINANSTGLVRYNGAGTFDAVTTVNHDVLLGSTSNGITNVAPSATTGVALISQGAASDPAFGTVVVAGGGTGATTLTGVLTGNGTSAFTASAVTNHGVLVGGASNAVSSTAVGSTGQILQANTGADPTYSTATYPSTAGTSGNVLTSDGTNWVSSAASGGGVLAATGTLTNSQIKNIHGTPIQILAAPGSGKVNIVLQAVAKLNYGGTTAFTAGVAQKIELFYSTTNSISVLAGNGLITATASTMNISSTNFGNVVYTNMNNVAVNAYNSNATEISGDVANDSTISYSVLYTILTI